MKKTLLGCLLLLTLVQACRKDNDTTQNGPIPTENVKSSLTGQVIDENGNPVAGALVLLENGNGQMTDAKGMFFYHDQLLNKNGAYIKVEKAGYFTSARFSFQQLNGASMMEVQLIPKKLAGTFDAASGGQFTFDNGAEVAIPASGLVTASGATYSGTVKAYAVWLDPSQQRTFDQMPGDLRAIDANGNGKVLTTYGMIGVELEGGAGEKLQIAPNQKAKIALTVPSSLQNTAPATIPLWHFDESNGYWVEEGSATLNNGRYEGEVSHFSFWNWGISTNVVILTGSVFDNSGHPLHLSGIMLSGVNGSISFGYSGANGFFGGIVSANESYTLEVYSLCGEKFYTGEVGPFSADATLDPIVISASNTVTIDGSAIDCTGNPIDHSKIVVEVASGYPMTLALGYSDSDGTFSLGFLKCSTFTDVSIRAYNEAQTYRSEEQIFTLENNTVNAGELLVCTPLDEYCKLTIDGIEKLLVVNMQFISSYAVGQNYGYILGDNLDSNRIEVAFRDLDNGQATITNIYGRYVDPSSLLPISFGCVYCEGCNCIPTDAQPIQFTNVPAAPGEYAMGSATGSVMVNDVLKPYTLSFRIKQ